MDLKNVFAHNMRKYRKQQMLSQEEFADLCGLHRTYISSIERCKRNVSIENVGKIATALNIPAYKLLVEDEKDG